MSQQSIGSSHKRFKSLHRDHKFDL